MPEEEPMSVEAVCENIQNAIEELKETKDYLSYATLLDVYLSDASQYNDEEKAEILTTLYEVFSANQDVVKEIGWDLPELLIHFYEVDFDFQGSLLKDTPIIKLVMSNFDLIARYGNPKEIFLKSTEMLSDMDDTFTSQDDEEPAFKIADIKLHTILELMSTSLKRINTIYPSRFLSMAITASMKVSNIYVKKTLHTRFIFRRLYAFARDYIPPMKPVNYLEYHGLTQEEADKIEDDENYLQRKLLQSFLTQLASNCFIFNCLDLSVELYKSIQYKSQGKLPEPNETDEELFSSSRGLFSRITQLGLSYDLEFDELFIKLKSDSIKLFESIDKSDKSDDEKIQDVLKFAINDKVSYMFHPEMKVIPLNQIGLLTFVAQYTKEISKVLPITIEEAICLTLRFLTPGLLSERFHSIGILDTCLFWCWAAIYNCKSNDFANIPDYKLVLLLQSLIYFSSITQKPSIRIVSYTLLTRVITYLKEDLSYNFLIDTLTTAPYENAKAAVVTILKDLIVRTKAPTVDDLTGALKTSKINGDDTAPQPPALPQRHYIELNNDRIDDIYTLVRESLDETFTNDEVSSENGGSVSLNPSSFKTTLSYLNLLIAIKERFSREKLEIIIKITESKLKLVEKNADKEQSQDPSINIGFISVALEPLKDFLQKNKSSKN